MPRGRWRERDAWRWYQHQPWLLGCNFVPSTAVNQLEMWQADTFDLETIRRELGWAADLGFNTVRVFLHHLLWQQDFRGLLARMEGFLEACHALGIRPMFVLLDGVWDPRPRPGPQPPPLPRVHNSRWVQSPGAEVLGDPRRHSEMEGYVRGVIGHFRDDERVLAWDLFNEPDNPNPVYAREEIPDKAVMALALLDKVFRWARAARPSQPVTAGVWRGEWGSKARLSAIDKLMLGESDIVSFHCYGPPEEVCRRLDDLAQYGRPVLLTEYMARPLGSTIESVLPLLRERGVGAYNWGLVAGKTQTIYPWDSWTRPYDREPEPWFHDLLRPDGTPYRPEEAALLGELSRS